jgi:flavin-dependent dehydrogenase
MIGGLGREVCVYEVVIVGGGPAGAAAALWLARAGRRVLMIEAAHPNTFKIGEALPPAARPILQDLGVWSSFVNDGHLPCYGNLSAWGADLLQSTDFIYDPNGHGWHLDRARFDALLREAAREAGAEVQTATSLKQLTYTAGCWHLILAGPNDKAEARCHWLVDATGRRSTVARRCGVRHRQDDRLIAFFALFHQPASLTDTDQDSRTLIEAAPDGWWYTALLPSKQRVVAYLTDVDLVEPRTMRTQKGYLSLLGRTEHVRALLAAHEYSIESVPKGIAASSARLNQFSGKGWLATGDAALSFDPLSSQGILTAIYTGSEAGQTLVAQTSGDSDALTRYSARLQTIYDAYLQNLSTYYTLEERWSDRPFWQRRRASHSTATTDVHRRDAAGRGHSAES